MTEPIVYIAGVNGAGVNNFVVPEIDQAGAPYAGTISELKVEVNGSEVTSGYTVAAGVLYFDVDRTEGDIIRLYRETDATDSLVVFPNPVKYSPVHNNKSITQWLYIVQELWGWIKNFCLQKIDILREQVWDFTMLRGVNLEDCVDAYDAVNKRSCLQMIADALSSFGSLSGISQIIKGTLPDGTNSLVANAEIVRFLLFVGGQTFFYDSGASLMDGLTSVTYDPSSGTTIVFDRPIFGGPTDYILIAMNPQDIEDGKDYTGLLTIDPGASLVDSTFKYKVHYGIVDAEGSTTHTDILTAYLPLQPSYDDTLKLLINDTFVFPEVAQGSVINKFAHLLDAEIIFGGLTPGIKYRLTVNFVVTPESTYLGSFYNIYEFVAQSTNFGISIRPTGSNPYWVEGTMDTATDPVYPLIVSKSEDSDNNVTIFTAGRLELSLSIV